MKRMKFNISSHAVKINGKIADVIKAYRENNIPMSQLLKDYSVLPLEDSPAMNCWAERQKKEHLPYVRGATRAETLMLTKACLLDGIRPTDVIRSAFYHKGNNDSAVECDVLQPLFSKAAVGTQSVVVQPSPDFLLKDFEEDGKTIYLVPDLLVAKLYRKEFMTNRILAFEEATSLPPIDRVLVMQGQYRDIENLLSPLHFLSSDAVVMAFMNHKDIKDSASPLWSVLAESSLSVRSAIRIDSAVVSTPKKKTLLTISSVPQETVDIWDSQYDEKAKQLHLFGPVRQISSSRFHNGGISWTEMVKGPKMPKTNQIRKPPVIYSFSDEIEIRYTEKTDQCGTPKIKASYYSIQHTPTNQKGEKLTKDVIHRIGKDSKENILEGIPFESGCRAYISADVRSFYAECLNQLSLKTCWFLCINALEADREYKHELACELFTGNNALARVRLQASTESDIITAMETTFGCPAGQINYSYWRQLDLIIKKIIRADLAASNPLEKYIVQISNRLTLSQREVRDALVKKTLEPLEMLSIINYLSSESNGKKKYSQDGLCVGCWIKVLTGISNTELCALVWDDYIKLHYGLGSQLRVTKYVISDGSIASYGDKDETKVRNIPVTAELQFILDAYLDYVKSVTNLPRNALGKLPIVMSSDFLKNGDMKPITPRKMNNISKKLLKEAGIDPQKVILHEGGKETEVDLNKYEGDFFRENAYHFFRQVCKMQDGEACYVVGKTRPTTVEQYYFGFSNELAQYRIAQEMQRGLSRYDEIIGLPSKAPATEVGCHRLHKRQHISSDGRHTVGAQLYFPTGCLDINAIHIQAEHGLRFNYSYKEEQKNEN